MSTQSLCRTCFRALRQGARAEIRPLSNTTRTITASQAFSTSATTHASTPSPNNTSSDSSSPIKNLAERLRNQSLTAAATEPYIAYGSTEKLFKLCSQAGDYTIPTTTDSVPKRTTAAGEDLGIPSDNTWYTLYPTSLLPTFNTWAQISMIHMYILTVRIRMFPAEHAKHWHQNLLDHFFYAAEDRMARFHGMEARSVRNKYLKDLFVQWRGVLAGYDEGLIRGDAVLAAAVWRNVFGGQEDVDVGALAEVVGWLRGELEGVSGLGDGSVSGGEIEFRGPKMVGDVVGRASRGVKEPFEG